MERKQMGTLEVVGGMALLLLGHRAKGLMMFGHGFYNLEQEYRQSHPELEPGFKARWREAVTFYEATHVNETNRQLHRWGIPVIVGGAVGLLTAPLYRKAWWGSAAAFAFGWALNILGHRKYEQNKPAFTEDPLSFIAGPVWDIQQLRQKQPSLSAPAELTAEHA